MSEETHKLVAVRLDERSLAAASADIEHERRIAIYDLIEENSFRPHGSDTGPYTLDISLADGRLSLDIRLETGDPVHVFVLSLKPFRGVIRDYFMVCDSYYDAIRTAAPSQIEALDMGRRGLHNEGSELLMERLSGKIDLDFDTARRLFTLVCALCRRGSLT